MDQTTRALVRGAYEIQKLRIQTGNRIVANLKARLGQKPGEKEETLDKKEGKMLKQIRSQYKKLTDGVKNFPRQGSFKGDEVISSYTELCLVDQYIGLEQSEAQHFKHLGGVIRSEPLWDAFLKGVKGAGPAMSGVILSEIDIHKARHPSSLWKYAGLDVASDGRGVSKRKEHLVDVEYTTSDGEVKTRKSITFNPFLKAKLCGVLADCIISAGDPKYVPIYRDYKARLENHPKYSEVSKGHRHSMAKRYMIKMFLIDLYVAWRTLEGLPVSKPYSEAKLGMEQHGGAVGTVAA